MSDASNHGFLGEEFLTWLWYRLETEGGDFDLGQGTVIGVAMDDYLEFAPLDEDETLQTMRKGMPTRSPEARTALRSGHRLKKAKLIVAQGEREWSFVLDGTELELRSVKLPQDDESCESQAGRDRERAAHFIEIHGIVRRLYARFLELRLRPDYLGSAAEKQAAWMQA
jgi:hypothetical protein